MGYKRRGVENDGVAVYVHLHCRKNEEDSCGNHKLGLVRTGKAVFTESGGNSGQFEETAFHSWCSSKANLLFSLSRRSKKNNIRAAKLKTAWLLRGIEGLRICVGGVRVQMSDSDQSWPQQAWSRRKCHSPTTDMHTVTDRSDKID